jgi:hypothetical protein
MLTIIIIMKRIIIKKIKKRKPGLMGYVKMISHNYNYKNNNKKMKIKKIKINMNNENTKEQQH